MRRTELVTSTAADRVRTQPTLFDEDDLRRRFAEIVLASPSVPARRDQRAALEPILEAFLTGLGPKAPEVLSANLDRAGARLVRLVAEEQRAYMAKPWFEEVVELRPFAPTRATDREVSGDRFGAFGRSAAFDGWKHSLFPIEWFDSRPERTFANVVDDANEVTCWVRLHTGELPILWNGFGQAYNPDFIVIGAWWPALGRRSEDGQGARLGRRCRQARGRLALGEPRQRRRAGHGDLGLPADLGERRRCGARLVAGAQGDGGQVGLRGTRHQRRVSPADVPVLTSSARRCRVEP